MQALRKDAGLDVADRIRVSVSTDAEAAAAITAHADFVKGEVLALDLAIHDKYVAAQNEPAAEAAGGSEGSAPRPLDLNGHPATLTIEKA